MNKLPNYFFLSKKKTLTLTFPLTKSDEEKKTIVKSANHPLCFEPFVGEFTKVASRSITSDLIGVESAILTS